MKKIFLALTLILSLLLCGCSNNSKNSNIQKEEKKVKEDKWGITLTLQDVTKEGATLVIAQKDGEFEGELQTGEDFYIEKNVEGKWEPCNTNPLIDYAWRMIAYKINKNGITELKLEWKWLYGELEEGKYRLNKRIMDFIETGNYTEKTYSVEFEIKGD